MEKCGAIEAVMMYKKYKHVHKRNQEAKLPWKIYD